jgi:DNA-binding NtrC family response regulator
MLPNVSKDIFPVLIAGAFGKRSLELQAALRGSEFEILCADSCSQAQTLIESRDDIACAILDHSESPAACYELLEALRRSSPLCQSLVLSQSPGPFDALEVTRRGAFWFLSEPFGLEHLLFLVSRACIVFELSQSNHSLQSALTATSLPHGYLGESQAVRVLLERIDKIACLDATVLLTGESGTGKTTLARLIHQRNPRRSGRFVSLSCAAIPRDLLESELFGHERGAFTGATAARAGSIELADGGTLFLDEIGDLPLELQPKLLTFLQDHTLRRIGSNKTRSVDIRILAATNKDLELAVQRREFREDLLYRINVITLQVPALRDRIEDVPELALHILARIAEKRGVAEFRLTPDALAALKAYSWPGNVRELENVLERASAFAASSSITRDDLLFKSAPARASSSSLASIEALESGLLSNSLSTMTLKEIEQAVIHERLERFHGSKSEAAKSLGVSLKTIYNKLEPASRD